MIVAGLVSLAMAFASDPQAAAAESEPNTVEEVVVQAAPPELVRRFVEGVSAETRKGRLGRWESGICPSVIGLPAKYGSYVAERMADTAYAVGLRPPVAPCRPDVVVLVTPEPDEAAARLADEQRQAMALTPRSGQLTSSAGKAALEAFLKSDQPVRWWHATQTTPSSGGGVQRGSAALPEMAGVNVISGTTSSRNGSLTQETFTQVLIVVDGRRLRGVSYEQLAAYLSVIALAQVAPEPEAAGDGLSSILTLFADVEAGRAAPDSLTAWDSAYLQGLYGARADARDGEAQKAAIAARMQKDARKAE